MRSSDRWYTLSISISLHGSHKKWLPDQFVFLRRRGFSNEVIENIHNAYRIIYQSGLNISDALTKVEAEVETSPEIEYIISFIRNSERGIIK